MLKPVRTVAPTVELITTAEAKAHLRVDNTDEDTLIGNLVSAATAHLDGYSGILGRALTTQTWKIEAGAFTDPLRLPVGDLIAVSSVKYYDLSNAQQTLATSVYGAFSDDGGPYIGLKADQDWPDVYDRRDAIEVIWTAGYGATAASVPQAIKQAALLLVGHWYANREAVSIGESVAEIPLAATALLEPFRTNRI
jgi:uncharacterized phiE125 gp8 family phage protein